MKTEDTKPSNSGELKLNLEALKRVCYHFAGQVAVGYDFNSSLTFLRVWDEWLETGKIVHWGTHPQTSKEVVRVNQLISEPVGKIEEKEELRTSKLKTALQDKIMEFEAYKTNPNYQSTMEQNAVTVTLRELKYLDSIVEYE